MNTKITFVDYLKARHEEEPDWFALRAMLEFYTGNIAYYPTGVFSRRRFSAMDKMIPIKQEGKAIDIGCSWGLMSIKAARKNYSVIALDTYPRIHTKLIYPQAEYNGVEQKVHGIVGVCQYLPMADESVDLAICGEIIEHLPVPNKLIEEAVRVLRPDGELIITTPNASNFFRKISQKSSIGVIEEHTHEFTPQELVSLINEVGSLEIKELILLCPNAYPFTDYLFEKLPWQILRKIYYLASGPVEKVPFLRLLLCDTIIMRCQKKQEVLE